MKMLRTIAVLASLFVAAPALAQWQTPNHSVPIGRGAGVTGFGSVAPGTTGQPLISNGASADPSYGTIANSGITAGAANTVKGSLNGTTVVDAAVPACTGVNQALRWTAGVGYSCGIVSVEPGFDAPVNLGLSASAAAGALTLGVTQADGTVPSASNPIIVPFRSTSATLGTVTHSEVTSALSLTIPSGATLGTSNSVPFRIWVFLTYNSGTTAVGVATCSNTTTIFPCSSWETTLKTTTTIGAGSTSAGTLYVGTGVVLDAVRIVGYCDFASGLVTAGTWASSCTTLQVFGSGVKKPGETVQTVYNATTTVGSVTNAAYTSLASGQSVSITPTTTPNLIRVEAHGVIDNSATSTGTFLRIVRGGSTQVGVPAAAYPDADTAGMPISFLAYDAPGSVASLTYSFQAKASAGTISYPATTDVGATIEIREIQG